jgi:hypothetical protein
MGFTNQLHHTQLAAHCLPYIWLPNKLTSAYSPRIWLQYLPKCWTALSIWYMDWLFVPFYGHLNHSRVYSSEHVLLQKLLRRLETLLMLVFLIWCVQEAVLSESGLKLFFYYSVRGIRTKYTDFIDSDENPVYSAVYNPLLCQRLLTELFTLYLSFQYCFMLS